MVRMLVVGRSVSSVGGRRLTLMEAGQPVVSAWAPTFQEALHGLTDLDSIRAGCRADAKPQARDGQEP